MTERLPSSRRPNARQRDSTYQTAQRCSDKRDHLSETLDSLAEYYEQEVTRSVGWMTELMQPAIILVIAGMVGFVGVAMFQGIYSTVSSLK